MSSQPPAPPAPLPEDMPAINGITDVHLLPPDRIAVVCTRADGGADLPISFSLGDLPAFLLRLQQAGEYGVEQLGHPPRHVFLPISRLEVLKADDVLTMVLHLGGTRVPLALAPDQARMLADALATFADDAPKPPTLN